MPKYPSKNVILVVDDDPGSAQRIATLAGAGTTIQTRFADTINAVSRTLESDKPVLVVLFANDENLSLIEPVAHLCRRQPSHLPMVVAVDLEQPDHALAAVESGVDSIVSMADDKALGLAVQRELEHALAHRNAASSMQRLEEIESRYTLLLDSSREAIAYVHQGLHIYSNGAYLEMFGYESFDELEGLSIMDLFSAEDSSVNLKSILRALDQDEMPDDNLPIVARRPDGDSFQARVTFSPARFNGEDCTQMLVREDTLEADPEMALELEKLRTTDAVTGLMNRQVFMAQVEQAMNEDHPDLQAGILFVELVDYSSLLSKVGMGAADDLIRQAATVVSHQVAEGDKLSRVRENTFALLVRRPDRDDIESLARQLLEAYSGHILQVRDRSLTVAAAVGMTYIGQQTRNAEEALHQSDTALSEAMRAGGNCFVRYQPRVDAEAGEAEGQWADRIRHALDNDEFLLVRQPIIDLEEDEALMYKVEARLRPRDSEEVHLPETYMPAAIRQGLAQTLDRDLIEKLTGQIALDPDASSTWLVPLSSPSISDPDFQVWLQELMDGGRLPSQQLVLQFKDRDIRESLLDTQRFIQRFAARGCHFSLADVDGLTPLDQLLKHLDLDFLELVPETTENISGDEDRRQILGEMVSQIRERNIRIIAPLVHNTNDMASLWQYGITLVQGEFSHDEPPVSIAG